MIRRAVAALGLVVVVAACAPGTVASPTPTRLRIAAASDLSWALEALIKTWSATHPDTATEPSLGSSGSFFAQISAGAPFDLFFSADAAYPRQLEAAGLATAGSTRLYAVGRIVVWVRTSSTLDVATRGLEALTDDSIQKIAIADPEHAPYGKAAVAAMKSVGVYDAVATKLVFGESVTQAAQFVESGNADVGVIALSLALAPPLKDEGRYALVPVESYPRLEQGAVVLRGATDTQAAAAFLDFVLGAEGRAVLDRYGFGLPTP